MSNFIETTLMDGYAGSPHITAEQTGLANQGLYGPSDYVLAVGKQAAAEVLTNNSIRIYDAVYVIQGRRDVIPVNGYEDVVIENGTQGTYRNDIIVRRYSKDADTGVESTSYAVIKGTANSSAGVDPEVTTGDIANGDTLHEMPIYRVCLEGLSIVSVESLFETLYTSTRVKTLLTGLTNRINAANENAITRANEQMREYDDHLELSSSDYFSIKKQKTMVNIRTGEVSVYMTGSMLQTVAAGKNFILAHLKRVPLIPEDDMVIPVTISSNLNNVGTIKAAMYPAGHSTYQSQIRGTVINQVTKESLVYVHVHYFVDPETVRNMLSIMEPALPALEPLTPA